MRTLRRTARQAGRLLRVGGAFLLLATAALWLYADRKISRLALGGLGESFSTRIYASPLVIGPGTRLSPERLKSRFERLRYRLVEGEPRAAGEYAWEGDRLTARLRAFETPVGRQDEGTVVLRHEGEGAWAAEPPGPVALEPELAAELSGEERIRREPASLEDIPDFLKAAVVSAEDKRFHEHWGIDLQAVARAFWHNLRGRRGLHGGSTITQQLVKNLFLTPHRTWRRKLAEAILSLYIELRYSKEEILVLYLNHIYLGQDGSASVAGVKAAARFYFGKELRRLRLAECAMLAGLIRSPYGYDPRRDPVAARERRDWVLRRMWEDGKILDRELGIAQSQPIAAALPPAGKGPDDAAFFVAETVRQLLGRYEEHVLFRQGLRVHTTMDPRLQRESQGVLRGARRQAAMVVLAPEDGRVLALAGGRDFRESQFNRATQALRQPGSAFKPFVYGAALESGFTAASLLHDAPVSFKDSGGNTWSPSNYDGVYRGTVTARQALALSLNAATIRLARQVGPRRVAAFARRLGVSSPLEESLALALGASETTLMELTAAYAPFANGGWKVEPRLIEAVADAEGAVLERAAPSRLQTLSPAQAYVMTSLLEGAVRDGTGRVLALLGWRRPAAGKTGTTNGGRDARFVGYVPGLLAGVWTGAEAGEPGGLTGGKDAAPLWAAFMTSALADEPSRDFERPDGIEEAAVDPETGDRAVSGCPRRYKEIFAAGTAPPLCRRHPGGVTGFFKRWFGGP